MNATRTPLLLAAVALAGCADRPAPAPPAATARGSSADDDHVHERDKMLLTDAGPYHVGLTAHLSKKDGNELDVFFETGGKDAQPVAVRLAGFTATARRAGDGKEFTLTFAPAPAAERPKDEPAHLCSHFVAKAPGLAADDELTVTAEIEIKSRLHAVVWKNFVPRKYAHHVD